MKSTDYQVAGDHYKKLKMQPIEYIMANQLEFAEGCIVKYISRWRERGGVDDLRKIKQYCDFIIESEIAKLENVKP
jgi:ribosomal protein L16/L10AE